MSPLFAYVLGVATFPAAAVGVFTLAVLWELFAPRYSKGRMPFPGFTGTMRNLSWDRLPVALGFGHLSRTTDVPSIEAETKYGPLAGTGLYRRTWQTEEQRDLPNAFGTSTIPAKRGTWAGGAIAGRYAVLGWWRLA